MIYPLNFPRVAATEKLTLNRRQSTAESTWTYARQTVHTASIWMLEWSWPAVGHHEAESLQAWLQSLKGQIGSFRYTPHQSITSTLTGKTLAQIGYAYNAAISVKGWAANEPTTLRTGQYFSIGGRLLQIVDAPVYADANGRATISFEPELRQNYATDTVVEFAAPVGIFSLASPDGVSATLTPDRQLDFGVIAAREDI